MSGHLFSDAGPITLQDYPRALEQAKQRLWQAGATRVEPVGTSGLKPVMGDIDLAVAFPTGRDGLFAALETLFRVKKVGNDLVSFELLYRPHHVVQVDCFVGNVDFIKWSRAGDATPGVKASARAVLWNVILTMWTKFESMPAADLERQRWVLDFGKGLYIARQTRQGKHKVLKDWKTIESLFVSDDPRAITTMFFKAQPVPYSFADLVACVRTLPGFMPAVIVSQARVELEALCLKHPGTYGDWAALQRILDGEQLLAEHRPV